MTDLATYLVFVRVNHTVFALPFALTGALLAWRANPFHWEQAVWIVLAMAAARSAAMGFNRIADSRYDALNPRTSNRELPRGAIGTREAAVFVIVASVAFVYAAFQLGAMCGWLSPVALSIVFWYSLAKRYTTFTQLFLGLAMAVAPVGGWLAAGGRAGWEPWVLAIAIGLWVSGFDILYSCQDIEFDRAHGLRSIPTRFGVTGAIRLSRVMHLATILVMVALQSIAGLPAVYLLGVALVAMLLAFEQSLVHADDLSQVKRAFDINGWVGISYLVCTAASIWLAG